MIVVVVSGGGGCGEFQVKVRRLKNIYKYCVRLKVNFERVFEFDYYFFSFIIDVVNLCATSK